MFNSNLITRVVTTLAILPISFGAVGTPEAQAANWRCGVLAGFNVCAVDRSYVDSLKLEWNNGDYTWIKVQCDKYSFRTTHGAKYITYPQAQAIVADWCE